MTYINKFIIGALSVVVVLVVLMCVATHKKVVKTVIKLWSTLVVSMENQLSLEVYQLKDT